MEAQKKPTANLRLAAAGAAWLSSKEWRRRKPRTLEASRCYLAGLLRFFGDIPLKEIRPGSLLAFQTARSKEVGPSYINHELNALAQILKQAGLWAKLKDFYAPLPEPEWQKPKVFTFEEQQRIFSFAKDDPNLELAEIVFTITRNTSASGSELRLARIGQVDLAHKPPLFTITADTTKNKIRPRIVPLLPEAEGAFGRAIRRANRLGGHLDGHFLFPFRLAPGVYDPTRPASRSWLRKQTAILRERTEITHLRPHAWRHQLATEMLEQGKPVETVRAIMGWVSEKMVQTYCHTRMEAKLDALSSLERMEPQPERKIQAKKIIMFPR